MLYILMMMVTTMQAANYDNWHPFILLAGILAFFAAGVLILGTWKVFNMIVDLSMISVISMAILVVWIIGDKCDASRKFIVLVEVILIKIVTVFSSGVDLRQRRQEQSGEKRKKNRVLWIIFASR